MRLDGAYERRGSTESAGAANRSKSDGPGLCPPSSHPRDRAGLELFGSSLE